LKYLRAYSRNKLIIGNIHELGESEGAVVLDVGGVGAVAGVEPKFLFHHLMNIARIITNTQLSESVRTKQRDYR
jgi:hypothetical protein